MKKLPTDCLIHNCQGSKRYCPGCFSLRTPCSKQEIFITKHLNYECWVCTKNYPPTAWFATAKWGQKILHKLFFDAHPVLHARIFHDNRRRRRARLQSSAKTKHKLFAKINDMRNKSFEKTTKTKRTMGSKALFNSFLWNRICHKSCKFERIS